MKSYVLYESTTQAIEQLEMSEDFFGGSEVALQNLRWQTQGFRAAFPHVPQSDVIARFATGFDRRGSNAVSLALNRSWEQQDKLITQLRLINAVSIYEAWSVSFGTEIGAPESFPDLLQSPEQLHAARRRLESHADPVMLATQAAYRRLKLHCENGLHELLVCYRAFKEARNCLAHGGGRASRRAEERWSGYEAIRPTWAGKGLMKQRPELPQIIEGQPIELTQQGVIGCVAALQRLMVTFDGLASGRSQGVDAVVARWQAAGAPVLHLSGSPAGRRSKFGGHWVLLGFPRLGSATQSMIDEFIRRDLVISA